MLIAEANGQLRNEIISLLHSQQLPVEDLPASLTNFLVATDGDLLIGVIGLEIFGGYGLLRSAAVHPEYRNRQVASGLLQLLECRAAASGIQEIYLLTETAAAYFARKGFNAIPRNQVPDAIKASSEFSYACPASATVMVKKLDSIQN
jgi:amino-acid N-acetyltransferase